MHTSTSIWLIKVVFRIHQILGQPCSFGRLVYQPVHNGIMSSKRKVTSIAAPSAGENNSLREECLRSSDLILNKPINKNSILSKYNEDCHKLGYSGQQISTKKVSQHIYLPPTPPSSNSVATVQWKRTRVTTTESKICDSRILKLLFSNQWKGTFQVHASRSSIV